MTDLTANTPLAGPEGTQVRHRRTEVAGIEIFYRECGPADAPVLLLPHGYPASSYAFRRLMPALSDRWRTVAPDLPGFGYSATPDPESFSYTFDGYSDFLRRFTEVAGLTRYALYLHDYGSQFGFRLAMAAPDRVSALIISNGDIYEDQHGPKYAPLKEFWNNPTDEGRRKLGQAVSPEGFRDEYVGEVDDRLAERIPPDLWTLAWAQLGTPQRRENLTSLLADQRHTVPWFARQQAYLRDHRPPTLIVWGHQDGYMPAGAAQAYHRDHPAAELHLIEGGHWLLETNFDEVLPIIRDFSPGR
ncbi:alpha/beta fold hydrolase [Microlunatus parietis]|uniref:Pimeloyl-ACP methyl ester carboxylesterase n=1 Tax=Microlunatus parietis TaxID=682979 RepID=A0A7Y9IDL6_9ACTN|nr:alpha/beta hydrolase [Microlunatus parietis]NYE75011.1 pimeloyl-ACP methyl ester carboxylesterase [Microlunatus parietis]